MGMFDSFELCNIKCPHCGEVSEYMEFQTKQFCCGLIIWVEGKPFTGMNITEGVIEGVYGGCTKPKCREYVTKRDGYFGGFGRRVLCDVQIKNGNVEKAINIRTD